MNKIRETNINDKLYDLTWNIIHKNTKKELNKLKLSKNEWNKSFNLLKEYILIDDICEIKCGSIIRWFSLKNKNKMPYTCIVCELKIIDDGIMIVCKNFANMFFSINLKNAIIFQKLNDDDKLIINTIELLNNNLTNNI